MKRSIMAAYFDLPNSGLRAYFGHVRSGQPEEYRTKFFKDKTLEEVLNGWKPKLNQLATEWPSLLDFENDLRKKVGPMSIMKPLSERMEDIDSYYDSILLESQPLTEESIAAAVKWFSHLRGLELRSQGDTLLKMKLSTNSGSPYFTKRRDVIEWTVPCDTDYENPRFVYQNIPGKDHLLIGKYACAVLGWRGQEGGPSPADVKQRVVWMFPFAVNICELQLYQPLIESCQYANSVPAWVSMEAVDEAITELFDTKSPEDLVVCTDFSKFDQHFNQDMQNAAIRILKPLLRKGWEIDDWFENVFPIKYNIPLCYDWDKFRFGTHGMGSGSGGTNADETLVHRALQYEVALEHGQQLNPHSQCLGDDGILSYPGITVDDVVKAYSRHGQEMNKDKQYASPDDCVYLRRWHHINYRIEGKCVGVYSTYRALGRLCEQERFYDPNKWGAKMVALRQLSILENVKYHPLNEEFVDYCMKGDKYRLGIDIPGFLDDIDRIAGEATKDMPDFLGYVRSQQLQAGEGISDWWIVRYLKSKR